MAGLTERFAEHRREIARRKTERERTRNNVEKEDFLLNQIDEFREKAKQLQSLLISKESKVQELQEIVEERGEGKGAVRYHRRASGCCKPRSRGRWGTD